MASAGQVIEGQGGFRLELIKTAAETDGELLEMEATYGGGGMPPLHLHPNQTERFEVLEGTVMTIVDGAERRYETGESSDVPAGTPHQMGGDGPARVRWEVRPARWQVRPAMRTAEFFEALYSGEAPNLLEEFSEEFRLVPTE